MREIDALDRHAGHRAGCPERQVGAGIEVLRVPVLRRVHLQTLRHDDLPGQRHRYRLNRTDRPLERTRELHRLGQPGDTLALHVRLAFGERDLVEQRHPRIALRRAEQQMHVIALHPHGLGKIAPVSGNAGAVRQGYVEGVNQHLLT